jgi:hypothetical protein
VQGSRLSCDARRPAERVAIPGVRMVQQIDYIFRFGRRGPISGHTPFRELVSSYNLDVNRKPGDDLLSQTGGPTATEAPSGSGGVIGWWSCNAGTTRGLTLLESSNWLESSDYRPCPERRGSPGQDRVELLASALKSGRAAYSSKVC